MVACLEKTKGNSKFHETLNFLTSSTIHHALTVSPTIYTSYIEQFWNTATSQTLNDEKQIHATVDSKEPMNQGRLSEETKELVSTARPGDSTVRPDVGTADPIVSPTTTSIFDDEDITMA
nr:hypothetical protein [Tanacetum cinerariifolium]